MVEEKKGMSHAEWLMYKRNVEMATKVGYYRGVLEGILITDTLSQAVQDRVKEALRKFDSENDAE